MKKTVSIVILICEDVYSYICLYIDKTYTFNHAKRKRKNFPRKELKIINHVQIVTDVYIILSK